MSNRRDLRAVNASFLDEIVLDGRCPPFRELHIVCICANTISVPVKPDLSAGVFLHKSNGLREFLQVGLGEDVLAESKNTCSVILSMTCGDGGAFACCVAQLNKNIHRLKNRTIL